MPFIWYIDPYFYLFVKDGVFQQNVKCISGGDFAPFLWAFVDVDTLPGVPERLAGIDTKLYIIFPTTPEQRRWKTLTKYTICVVVLMNPWLLEELRLA
jgi:hypothetical protein